MKTSELLARVKWKPVITVAILVALIFFLLFSSSTKVNTSFFSSYKGDGDVRVKSWADPSTVKLEDESKAWVEVVNNGDDTANIKIIASAYDKALSIDGTGLQAAETSFELGPKESRQISFDISFKATYGGKYGVKITVSAGGNTVEDEIFFDVKEK